MGIKERINKLNILHKIRIYEAVDSIRGTQHLSSGFALSRSAGCSDPISNTPEWENQDQTSSLPIYFSQEVSKSFLLPFLYESWAHYTFKQPAINIGKRAPHLAKLKEQSCFSGTSSYCNEWRNDQHMICKRNSKQNAGEPSEETEDTLVKTMMKEVPKGADYYDLVCKHC